MSYMLIDLSTGNVVGFFPTERDALREVAESIKEDGPESADTLALGYNDPAGPVQAIAEGADLVARALRVLSPAHATDGGHPTSPAGLRNTVTSAPLTRAEDR